MAAVRRIIVALLTATSLALALSAEPAYAAGHRHPRHLRPAVSRPVHTRSLPLARQQARAILVQAARHHNLNPNFVLAVSYWESGWNQASLSRTGAVGLMQIEPYTAAWAAPALLHRGVNLWNPVDNAELGAALLRYYLDRLHDPKLVLAAYYQGMSAVLRHGIYPSSRTYVNGIWRLRNQFQAQSLR